MIRLPKTEKRIFLFLGIAFTSISLYFSFHPVFNWIKLFASLLLTIATIYLSYDQRLKYLEKKETERRQKWRSK